MVSGNALNGILIEFSSHNNIYGNFIGIDANGSAALDNGRNGVSVLNCKGPIGVGYNNIGGSIHGQGNIISGNTQYGVSIDFSFASYVYGNFIGTDAGGTIPRANGYGGVLVTNYSNGTDIGGSDPDESNVISGNNGDGVVHRWRLPAATSCGATSSASAIPASPWAMHRTGSTSPAAPTPSAALSPWDRNFIGGNAASGILLDSSNVINVYGNTIGDPSGGYGGQGNANGGIRITGGAHNIGGTAAGQGNEICGNTADGVYIRGCSGNNVFGNRIAGNSGNGVLLTGGADGNTIGGNTVNHRNIICANAGSGININSSAGNSVKGNLLGIDAVRKRPGEREQRRDHQRRHRRQ